MSVHTTKLYESKVISIFSYSLLGIQYWSWGIEFDRDSCDEHEWTSDDDTYRTPDEIKSSLDDT